MAARFLLTALCLLAFARTLPAAPEQRILLVYDCDNLSTVTVRGDRAGVEVVSTGTRLFLPAVDATASRYSDGTTTLTMRDGIIRLERLDRAVLCRSAPGEIPWEEARMRGVEVRAVGDDPGWILEIDAGMAMTFVANGGSTRFSVPVMGRVIDDRHLTVAGLNIWHEIEAVFERKVCAGATGVTTSTVTVVADGMLYRGCARILVPGVLAGTVTWPDGPPVPAGAELIVQIVGAGPSNAGRVLAESRTIVHGGQPIPIQIPYERAAVFGADRYIVQARIDVHARTRWISRATPPVVTWGNIGRVDLLLTATPR